MMKLICKLAPLLFLLAACAAPQTREQVVPVDPSRPTTASIYYYLSGSLLHYEGDYVSAGQLYTRAAEQDPYSPQIQKQILLNSAYAYLNNQQDAKTTLADFAVAREAGSLDLDELNAAYSVYSQAKDDAGLEWTIAESLARFPSTRAYLQKYYFDYEHTQQSDKSDLEKAYKLAKDNPEDLVLTARMYAMADPQRSIAILKQALKISPKPEVNRLLNDFILQFGTQDEARKQFLTYSYPEDQATMLAFLQTANKNKAWATIIKLQDAILPTSDSSLIGELAFAAYLQNDQATLNIIYQTLISKTPEPEADSRVAVFLLAEALFSDSFPDANEFADMLYGIQDVDDVILYSTLRYSLSIQSSTMQAKPEFFAELAANAKNKLSPGPMQNYLLAQAKATAAGDPEVSETREKLCEDFVAKNRGYEMDWSTVLSKLHTQERSAEKFATLRKAIERFPDTPIFLNDLGYSLLDVPESHQEAGALISRAIALEPNNAYYQDSMAWYYYLAKDYPNALVHIQLPMQLETLPGEIAYHIGMILNANGDSEKAISYLKTAAQDTGSPDYQVKANNALAELGVKP
jgi:tetratricopeptide (TPR) repeat protein